MATILKKIRKKSTHTKKSVKVKMPLKRKRAIEKAVAFWENHSVDLSGFKFDREEANER